MSQSFVKVEVAKKTDIDYLFGFCEIETLKTNSYVKI